MASGLRTADARSDAPSAFGVDETGPGTDDRDAGRIRACIGARLPHIRTSLGEALVTIGFDFDNSYARLPEEFFVRIAPTPVRAPRLIRLNEPLARELGLDPEALRSPEGVEILAGVRVPEGSEPLAAAYAGHQFGSFVPQLGDGRAVLLGEVVDRHGNRRDIQLKGSGRTPFSRGGDGRAALGPVLREYVVSEAMAAFGVPTTRALAAVSTGEHVLRDEILPGAVLTRVAASHIRVGTFQFFAARRNEAAVKRLADHVIERHYPELAGSDAPYRALLGAVAERQARLVADWMASGFIHGVMNTDNMTVSGETIDYGPCAFMDAHHPETVFSSIDRGGRYAYENQPGIALWNLARLAECLLPLIAPDGEEAVEIAQTVLAGFADMHRTAHAAAFRAKLGLTSVEEAEDEELIRDLLDRMAGSEADFTLTFRRLSDSAGDPERLASVRALFADPDAFDPWAERWIARLGREASGVEQRRAAMKRTNPARIPRNHRVEEAIAAATERNDFGPFEALIAALEDPFSDRPEWIRFEEPPRPEERVTQTFCGT